MFRILHIDDEELIRNYLEDLIESLYEDVEILGFSTWSEAEKFLIKDDKFDLVLLDEVMPMMNGSEIMEVLNKKYPALAEKIVFVAGPSNILNYDKPHIKKPFDLSTIQKFLDNCLKDHQDKS
ncbi:MAG: hypothetical protein COA79_13255 [Planctomycetota bacterium]|nr:MAG: hypothetical protein COA79_13255 [Planctomycetota bacterium]